MYILFGVPLLLLMASPASQALRISTMTPFFSRQVSERGKEEHGLRPPKNALYWGGGGGKGCCVTRVPVAFWAFRVGPPQKWPFLGGGGRSSVLPYPRSRSILSHSCVPPILQPPA